MLSRVVFFVAVKRCLVSGVRFSACDEAFVAGANVGVCRFAHGLADTRSVPEVGYHFESGEPVLAAVTVELDGRSQLHPVPRTEIYQDSLVLSFDRYDLEIPDLF